MKVSILKPDIKTEGHNYPRDESIGNLLTGWAMSGIEMARDRFRHFGGTAGTRIGDGKGESQVKESKAESTKAPSEDGPACMSDDVSVMDAEQRGRIVPVEPWVNSTRRMNP